MGRYSTPIKALISRLEFHATAGGGGLLDGVQIVEAPIKEVEGKADVPSIRIMIPDMMEHFAPARTVDGTITVKIFVSTDRDDGIAASSDLLDHVLDALQTDANGNITAIPGTARHFDCKVEEGHSTDVSIVVPLSIFLKPFRHEVGKRSASGPIITGGAGGGAGGGTGNAATADNTFIKADTTTHSADEG